MDKVIIIDGVDVSGYEHFKINRGFNCYKGYNCTDKECSDCYYKQLKRKEQENEELKRIIFNYGGEKLALEKDRAIYTQALQEIRKYCEEQNLKADYTACEIIDKINEVIGAE